MAPSLAPGAESALSKRVYYYCDYDDQSCRDWAYWGRWVLAGIVILVFFLLFVVWGCISSRRRRRRGQRPFYGTGWMAPPKYPGPPGQGPGTYPPPPPAYGAPPHQTPSYTGTSFNTHDGYYGHHEGIQMSPQPPQNTYQPPVGHQASGANQEYFAPPAGPPPGK